MAAVKNFRMSETCKTQNKSMKSYSTNKLFKLSYKIKRKIKKKNLGI